MRAQSQLRETLSATLSRVISCPQIVIPGVNQKIRDGRFVDETTIEFMLAAVDDLIGEIKVLTYLFGESLVSTFTAPSEQAWIARYDFDFAAAGLSGLTLGLKYVKGDEVDPTLLKTSQTASLRKMARNGSALPTPPTPYKAARSRTYRHSGATPRTFPPMPTVPMKIA
ncbi:Porin-like protein NicP precursor [compost metagenome]